MSAGVILFVGMLILIVLGVPIGFSLGISSVIYLLIDGTKELILVPQRVLVQMDSFTMLAIPLFTFAGYLMEQGGLSVRLVRWADKIFGNLIGGVGTVAIVCCTIFAALTGSGPATVIAIGTVIMPALLASGYHKDDAAGLIAAGGCLGPVIPPSVCMIVYATTMSLSIPAMFISAVFPGIFMAMMFIVLNIIICKRRKITTIKQKHTAKEILVATWKAIPVLLLPIIILGGIYGGVFTPTEAAAVATVYALILGFAFKELTIPKTIEALKKTVYTTAMIMLVIGVSGLFGWIMSSARVPATLAGKLLPFLKSQASFKFLLIVILLFVGCFIDIIPSILILGPILVPIGTSLGIDPLHLGVFFCIVLVVGFITPPFGLNLFAVTPVSGSPFAGVVRGVIPYVAVAILSVIVMAFVPELFLWLPRVLGYS